MTVDPADAIQHGLYALLSGDTALDGLTTGIFDEVPESVEPNYVTIGEITATPDGAHASLGQATSCVVHTWTRAESHKPGNAIGARVVALLDHQEEALDAVVAGHKVWMVHHVFTQTLKDPEPGIRHRVDRFTVWTKQEA